MPKHPLLSQTQQRTYMVTFILLSSEVILLYSHCAKERLVYIAIMAPSSRQPSSYSKCTSANIQSSYNVYLVSNAKYIFYIYLCLYPTYFTNRNT